MPADAETRDEEPRHRPGGPCTRVSPRGNRAVSGLFRVFGGRGREKKADGFERTRFGAMHAAERALLGWAVSLTVFVALSERLVDWCGPWTGWILSFPASFLFLTGSVFLIPVRTPVIQWWFWLALCGAWAWWRKDEGGYVAVFAWAWIAILALESISWLILGIGRTFRWSGWPGAVWRLSLFIFLHLVAFADHWFWGWAWAIAGGISISALCCLAILRPGSQWLGPVTVTGDPDRVLITIDDGPDPEDTPKLLDLLDEHGVKAVFFVIGKKVLQYPELAREIVRRGHGIGNHTMTHPQGTFWCAGPWRTLREISECQKAIEKTTGITPHLFRAPVGHRNLFTHPFAGLLRLEVMAWNRRGFDAVEKDANVVLRKILPVSEGDIVLMHESTPIAVPVLTGILEALERPKEARPDV